MNYQWYRSEWAENGLEFKDDIIPIVSDDYYDVLIDYVKYDKKENESFPFRKLYKKIEIPGETEEESTIDYIPYTGIDWPKEGDLYSQITVLKIKKLNKGVAEKDITGKYYVKATNVKDAEKNLESTGTTPPCVLFKPDAFSYTEDLSASETMNSSSEITLSVKLNPSDKNPVITHSWQGTDGDGKSITIDSTKINSSDTGSSCVVTTPGFYSVTTTSTLNRLNETVTSTSCKVVNQIQAPQITACYCDYSSNNSYDKDKEGLLTWINKADDEDSTAIQWNDFDDTAYVINNKINYADIFFLRIDHDLLNEIKKEQSLKTDKLTYEWYYSKNDNTSEEKITNALVGENNLVPTSWKDNLNNNSIALRCVWNDGEAYTFKCKIINSLGTQNDASVES